MRPFLVLLCAAVLASCAALDAPGENPEETDSRTAVTSQINVAGSRTVRLSGTLEAVRSTHVVVPQLTGPSRRLTLTRVISNGERVEADQIVAEFDPVDQIDQARISAALYEDLSYQVLQKEADNAANVEKRRSALGEAEASLEKAILEVSRAEILARLDAEQNEIRADKARAQVESLTRKQVDEEQVDQTALRLLELRRDRQRDAFERAEANLDRLQVRTPIAGMVALSTRYRNGATIRPQEGDQMNRNNALMNIFDRSEMVVRTSVAEPDGALLHPGMEATIYVDAYPDLALRASFVAASPVAVTGLGLPIKSFSALFRLEESDPRLMPDLSAAVVFVTAKNAPSNQELPDVAASAGDQP